MTYCTHSCNGLYVFHDALGIDRIVPRMSISYRRGLADPGFKYAVCSKLDHILISCWTAPMTFRLSSMFWFETTESDPRTEQKVFSF